MILPLLLLTACGGRGEGDRAEELLAEIRGEYLEMSGCTGQADITADYGQRVYTYRLDFSWKGEGETVLTLTAPENVAGTTAHLTEDGGSLEYDGVMVETGTLTVGGLTPMGAIPAFLECIREGYLAEWALEDGQTGEELHIISRDPEQTPGQGMEVQLWFAPESHTLLRGEVSEEGVTVLQCGISGFSMERPQTEQ